MEFWLSDNNNAARLQLPVNPAEFTISKGNQNQTVNINAVGEINIIGKPGLASISLASFFPAHNYYFCQYQGFPSPYDCVQLIDSWKQSGKPIRLMITDADINMAMVIETFEYGEKAGSRDVNFALALKEFRFLEIAALTPAVPAGPPGRVAAARPANQEMPREYTVKPGDSLWMIAKRLTGNGSNYTAIAQKNGIKNPDLIYPGQKLVIG